MKTTCKTQKTSHTNLQSSPFFNKSGKGTFFSNSKEVEPPFFTPSIIQTKLTIGQPGDKYEQEADTMADEVVQKLEHSSSPIAIQKTRKDLNEEEINQMEEGAEKRLIQKSVFNNSNQEHTLQRLCQCPACTRNNILQNKSESQGDDISNKSLENKLNSSKGRGTHLSSKMKSSMEAAMESDFSKVRIHTGAEAVQLNKIVGSHAFTYGNDIYFNSNKYDENSKSGKHLLAHELTHTIQQGRSTIKPRIQRIPQNPDNVPFHAEVIPWSAALRETPSHQGRVIVDVPRSHTVRVIGGRAWIQVETEINGERLTGYISHELLRQTHGSESTEIQEEETPSTAPSINLLDEGKISWNESTPERITITGTGVSPRLIASDLYNNESLATEMQIQWNVETDERLTVESEIPVGRWVRLEYQHLKPELQTVFDSTMTIQSRDSWGARPHREHSDRYDYFEYTDSLEEIYDSIAVHHAGNSGYRTMSEIQDHHMDDKDKADVGYHYGINLQGSVFEGRPINIRGAHVDQGNTGVIGIVLLADLDTQWWDDDDELTPEMEASLLRLIHSLLGRYPNIQFLGGHREFNTDRTCPGDIGMRNMSSWRSSTGLQAPTAVSTP